MQSKVLHDGGHPLHPPIFKVDGGYLLPNKNLCMMVGTPHFFSGHWRFTVQHKFKHYGGYSSYLHIF